MGNTSSPITLGARVAVHPHARGEHARLVAHPTADGGSSPRPWGTLEGHVLAVAQRRFIPTPVGNTAPRRCSACRNPVHPHARGEHVMSGDGMRPHPGSSPRPWGTPAHLRTTTALCPVHPHARGEHSSTARRYSFGLGSSPRPWGTQGDGDIGAPAIRFIPTPVGNTSAASRRCASGPVHPHARGEHLRRSHWKPAVTGSSPRPWGTQREPFPAELVDRFIPTPVGNTGTKSPTIIASNGSSPRPWGTPALLMPSSATSRFIPTPVGNTSSRDERDDVYAVHPHARGEHLTSVKNAVGDAGSSPRPWGTLGIGVVERHGTRFIPTPVGNTSGKSCSLPSSSVHPHARGEHSTTRLPVRVLYGSSPRPWGTRPATSARRSGSGSSPRPWGTLGQRRGLGQHVRFIPTPVGNTEASAR